MTLHDYIDRIEKGIAEIKKNKKPVSEIDLLLLLLTKKVAGIEKRLTKIEAMSEDE